ncbi:MULTISPECIES: hypothetical protein [Halorussus]|uniref:hypothetical protein n=1 Tax=Halorussus TaxID=1070314 RepID=UPI00209E3941|nr:hypothetical protein [Halorussus vallis]USZ75376.1 hypothetical protein NGM07_18325 [Halorussus vallis]
MEIDMNSPSLTWRGKLGYYLLYIVGMGLALLTLSFTIVLSTLFQIGTVVLFLLLFGQILSLIHNPYKDSQAPIVHEFEQPYRSEYVQLCAEFGTPVEGSWVTYDLWDAYGYAEIRGLIPKNRHLFLDADFFDLYADEERIAAIAWESKLADSFYPLFSTTLIFLTLATYIAIVVVSESVGWVSFSNWPLVPELLLVPLLLLGILWTRRKVYRADEFAARRTSVDTAIVALAKLEREKSKTNDGRAEIALASKIWTRPSPRKRIAHLRTQKADDTL